MTTTAPRAARTPSGSASKWILLVAIVALLVLNAVNLVFLRPGGSTLGERPPVAGAKIVQAVAIAAQRGAAYTTDSRLLILASGGVEREKTLTETLSALSASPDRLEILGGTANNQVIVWDDQLNEVARFPVGGRVTDLRMNEAGEIVVAYGIGQYIGKFWVGRFDRAGAQSLKKAVGADVNAIEVDAQSIYYAPVNGKLIALQPDGKRRWETTLNGPGLTMGKLPTGNLLVGDERGGVHVITPGGKAVWSRQMSEYKIRMAVAVASGRNIAVGDDDGKVFILDAADGKTIFQAASSSGSPRGLVSDDPAGLAMVTNGGAWLTVNLAGAMGAQRQQAIDTAVLAANVALAAVAVAALVASVPRLRTPALKVGRKLKASRKAYLMLLPAFSLIIVFNYIPTAMGLYYSFTNFNLSEPIKFIGFNNFVRLSKDDFFWEGIGNMILILVTSVAKEMVMPLLAAELVFWLRSARLKYWTRTAFIIPSIVPGVVGIMLWKTIYNAHNGLVNEVLQAIGLGYLQNAWLGDEKTALAAIIFAGFPWIGTFAFLIYIGGLLNINRELFDSAAIDGTNAWSRFWNIDMPLIKPQLRLILFFAFLGSVQGYAGVWIFTQGGPGSSTYVPGLQMFLQTARGEYGYAAAIGLVLAIVVLAITVARFRFNQTPDEA